MLPLCSLHDQCTACNQSFLVGKGDGFPRFDGSQCRQQSHHTHHGIEKDISFLLLCDFAQTIHAGQNPDVGIRKPLLQVRIVRFVVDTNTQGRKFSCLLFQFFYAAVGSQCGYVQFMLPGNLQCLGTDGTGTAQ